MKLLTKAHQEFDILCRTHNFVCRGNAFFRINGDGVLQFMKIEKDTHWPAYDISFGMLSMYDELNRDYFTSGGCMDRYLVAIFMGQRGAVYLEKVGDIYESRILSLDSQVGVLEKTVIPFLNDIKTQAQLAEALCTLDKLAYHKILWNDIFKFAPFLASSDFDAAQRVIQTILDQHEQVAEINRGKMSDQEFVKYHSSMQERLRPIIHKQEIIRKEDKKDIDQYLQDNYARNLFYAKFLYKDMPSGNNSNSKE